MLDEGNTILFITRYRKEAAPGASTKKCCALDSGSASDSLRQLADRKQTVLKSIENQGRLTPELRAAVLAADNPKRLEDIYLPYKPKKRSLATAAREKGLEPLATCMRAVVSRPGSGQPTAKCYLVSGRPRQGAEYSRKTSSGRRASTSWRSW